MNHESSTASCTHALVHNRLACDMRVLAVKREPTLILEPFLRRSLSQRLFRLVQSGTPSQQVAANNPSTSRSQHRTKQYLCTRPLPAAFGGAELELASACRTAPPRPSSCHTYLLIMHASLGSLGCAKRRNHSFLSLRFLVSSQMKPFSQVLLGLCKTTLRLHQVATATSQATTN